MYRFTSTQSRIHLLKPIAIKEERRRFRAGKAGKPIMRFVSSEKTSVSRAGTVEVRLPARNGQSNEAKSENAKLS